jgi:transposase
MYAPTFDGIDVPEWKCQQPLEPEGARIMQIATIGIDLAKNVLQIHGANERGEAVLRKQLRRDQVIPFFANLQACLIGIEACSSAYHWARKLQALGHTVRLMAPQFVKPYVKSNKNDVADAEAICEAVSRPTMRFVPIKNVEQQSEPHRVSRRPVGLSQTGLA